MMEPVLDTLPPPQRQLWDELHATPAHFVLYGGTALALRLAHRESEDFDFFSNESFDADRLLAEVPYLRGAHVLQRENDTLTCLADRGGPIRVSFFGGLKLNRINDPEPAAGPAILVASLLDIAATKVQVVQSRALAKDYLDLESLIRVSNIPLDRMLRAAIAVYGETFNPLITLKALSFYGDGDLGEIGQRVRKRLTTAATEVDITKVEALRPIPGLLPSGA